MKEQRRGFEMDLGSDLLSLSSKRNKPSTPSIGGSSRPSVSAHSHTETKQHLEQMKQGSSNILVAVRVRPIWKKELEQKHFEITKVMDGKLVILMDPADILQDDYNALRRSKEKRYAFDFAFDEKSAQKEVYENTTKFLIGGVLAGFNATVFAYGATGAGKTYTMLGTFEKPGIMALTFNELFSKMKNSQEYDYALKFSYLEIYNENIRDLLIATDGTEFLDLREDPNKGTTVAGLTSHEVKSTEELMRLLFMGNKRRTQEPTDANEQSSRSHAVLQVRVEARNSRDVRKEEVKEVRIGKLSLIDLAGSQRAARTNNRGIRMIEGANINRSLLALGNVINALCEQVEKGVKMAHIPYRDSKLTRLLKDSLGGNCRTVMIANISPASHCYEDTHNTLKYANRAKNIKTQASRNILSVDFHVAKFQKKIEELRGEISQLKSKLIERSRQPGQGLSGPQSISSGNNYTEDLLPKLEQLQQQIEEHFEEEAKTQEKIHGIEEKIENAGFAIFQKQTEMREAAKNWGEDNPNVMKIGEDIQKERRLIADLKKQEDQIQKHFQFLQVGRDKLRQKWRACGLRDLPLSLLSLKMKQNTTTIENLDLQRKQSRSKIKLSIKDMVIKQLEDQIRLRDDVLETAKEVLLETGVQPVVDLNDKRLETLDEIGDRAASHFFPMLAAHQSTLMKQISPEYNSASKQGTGGGKYSGVKSQLSLLKGREAGSLPPIAYQKKSPAQNQHRFPSQAPTVPTSQGHLSIAKQAGIARKPMAGLQVGQAQDDANYGDIRYFLRKNKNSKRKNYLVPRGNNQSPLEERKRNGPPSAHSTSSVVSTASSNNGPGLKPKNFTHVNMRGVREQSPGRPRPLNEIGGPYSYVKKQFALNRNPSLGLLHRNLQNKRNE